MGDITTVSALLYAVICGGVIIFQICLIFGAPWGPLTQGGAHQGALPKSGRIAAAASIVLLSAMASSILLASGSNPEWPRWSGWVTVGIQTLSMVLNWITRSIPERRLWGPITTLMLVLCLAALIN